MDDDQYLVPDLAEREVHFVPKLGVALVLNCYQLGELLRRRRDKLRLAALPVERPPLARRVVRIRYARKLDELHRLDVGVFVEQDGTERLEEAAIGEISYRDQGIHRRYLLFVDCLAFPPHCLSLLEYHDVATLVFKGFCCG